MTTRTMQQAADAQKIEMAGRRWSGKDCFRFVKGYAPDADAIEIKNLAIPLCDVTIAFVNDATAAATRPVLVSLAYAMNEVTRQEGLEEVHGESELRAANDAMWAAFVAYQEDAEAKAWVDANLD